MLLVKWENLQSRLESRSGIVHFGYFLINRRRVMQRIKEDIKNRNFHSVYLLHGEERYLVRLYRDRLKQAVLDGGDEMNYSSFHGSSVDLLEVREIAETLPFFQDYRIIIWEESKLFKSSNDFAEYLSQMPDTTIIVFVEKEVDKRNKLYKYVQKNGLAVEMTAMSAADTKKFVAVKLRDNHRKIRESTAEYFLEQVEGSLNNIENELDKLIAYTYGREEITREDIDAVCSVQVTGQIFKLLDAVAGGKKQEMMRLYHDLLELKESPMSILYLLTRHFNILLQMKTLSRDLSKQEIAKKAGIPPFSVGKYQIQCKHFTKEQLRNMLKLCVNTEFDFKQGKISDQIGVEALLVELTGI